MGAGNLGFLGFSGAQAAGLDAFSPPMVHVETILLNSNATSVSFLGLNGDEDGIYVLYYWYRKGATSAIRVDIRPNGITTNQRFELHYWGNAGTAHALQTQTVWEMLNIGGANTDDVEIGRWTIYAKTGNPRVAEKAGIQRNPTGGTTYGMFAVVSWQETVTVISSLDIVCTVAAGIQQGSIFSLYRIPSIP